QNDPSGPAGHPVIQIQLKETGPIHTYITSCDLEMNGKVGGRGPVSSPNDMNCNSNSITMRSNSMRRNPKAVVAKQGWLYKQASSGVKQWNKRWFVLTDRCLFYYKDEKEEGVLGSLPLLSFRIGEVQALDNISRKHAFKVSGGRGAFVSGLVGPLGAEEERRQDGMEVEFEHDPGDSAGIPVEPLLYDTCNFKLTNERERGVT
ncbi:unnamed protein product, partial [Coregonus sp. 'balchen']